MNKICSVENCNKPIAGRGFCQMHYRRANLYGSPYAVMRRQRDSNTKSKVIIHENYALVELTQNKFATIDLPDIAEISKYAWNCSSSTGYAYCSKIGTSMQQFLLGKAPIGFVISHENENKLDNRRENLKFRTQSFNRKNSERWREEKGYSLHISSGKYQVYISLNNKSIYLGLFATEKDAADARQNALALAEYNSSEEDFISAWKSMRKKVETKGDKKDE